MLWFAVAALIYDSRMKVAIIGSGAAAVGVISGLERWAGKTLEITVFDPGKRLDESAGAPAIDGTDVPDMQRIYRQLRAVHGYSVPPPKSRFGRTLAKLEVAGKPLLWHSEHRGGLTSFWGGAMFPFTDRELTGWPISAAELDPYYRMIADKVGIGGKRDALNRYFANDYVNRPPLRTSAVIDHLEQAINHPAHEQHDVSYRLIAGANRIALETRPDHPNQCTYSGICTLGCPRHAIWSAGPVMEHSHATGVITRFVAGRVLAVKERRVTYETPGGRAVAGPFDRVFIAAGCIGSTEIVMRSLGIERGPVMLDNAVRWFPLLYPARVSEEDDRYFALSNLSMIGLPRGPRDSVIQASVYPCNDHIWRYYTPVFSWPWMQKLGRFFRWRLLLVRVYMGGAGNRSFLLSLDRDRLRIAPGDQPDTDRQINAFVHDLRAVLAPSGFFIPPLRPGQHETAAHYTSTFPYRGSLLDLPRHGKIAPGVHLVDASTFVGLPAILPTFTIMANACRSARESLDD